MPSTVPPTRPWGWRPRSSVAVLEALLRRVPGVELEPEQRELLAAHGRIAKSIAEARVAAALPPELPRRLMDDAQARMRALRCERAAAALPFAGLLRELIAIVIEYV